MFLPNDIHLSNVGEGITYFTEMYHSWYGGGLPAENNRQGKKTELPFHKLSYNASIMSKQINEFGNDLDFNRKNP